MKFKDYVAGLAKSIEKNPEMGEYETIYSRDDEGNGYQTVHYNEGQIGTFDGEYGGDFIPSSEFEENPEEYEGYDQTPNAVCIN